MGINEIYWPVWPVIFSKTLIKVRKNALTICLHTWGEKKERKLYAGGRGEVSKSLYALVLEEALDPATR